MYIGMPYDADKGKLPMFGLFIDKPFSYGPYGVQFEIFIGRRSVVPLGEHCHRVVFSFGWYLDRRMFIGYGRKRWRFFRSLILTPAWMDEPTALAHYKDKSQKWRI